MEATTDHLFAGPRHEGRMSMSTSVMVSPGLRFESLALTSPQLTHERLEFAASVDTACEPESPFDQEPARSYDDYGAPPSSLTPTGSVSDDESGTLSSAHAPTASVVASPVGGSPRPYKRARSALRDQELEPSGRAPRHARYELGAPVDVKPSIPLVDQGTSKKLRASRAAAPTTPPVASPRVTTSHSPPRRPVAVRAASPEVKPSRVMGKHRPTVMAIENAIIIDGQHTTKTFQLLYLIRTNAQYWIPVVTAKDVIKDALHSLGQKYLRHPDLEEALEELMENVLRSKSVREHPESVRGRPTLYEAHSLLSAIFDTLRRATCNRNRSRNR